MPADGGGEKEQSASEEVDGLDADGCGQHATDHSEVSRPSCHTKSKPAKTLPRASGGMWVWRREVKVTAPVEVPRR